MPRQIRLHWSVPFGWRWYQSLTENIDTTTSGGKLIFHIFGALAEFEREVIRERTKAGLTAARSRGRLGGRPRKLDQKKIRQLRALSADKSLTIPDILDMLKISKSTYYRYLPSQAEDDAKLCHF